MKNSTFAALVAATLVALASCHQHTTKHTPAIDHVHEGSAARYIVDGDTLTLDTLTIYKAKRGAVMHGDHAGAHGRAEVGTCHTHEHDHITSDGEVVGSHSHEHCHVGPVLSD